MSDFITAAVFKRANNLKTVFSFHCRYIIFICQRFLICISLLSQPHSYIYANGHNKRFNFIPVASLLCMPTLTQKYCPFITATLRKSASNLSKQILHSLWLHRSKCASNLLKYVPFMSWLHRVTYANDYSKAFPFHHKYIFEMEHANI